MGAHARLPERRVASLTSRWRTDGQASGLLLTCHRASPILTTLGAIAASDEARSRFVTVGSREPFVGYRTGPAPARRGRRGVSARRRAYRRPRRQALWRRPARGRKWQ